MKEKLTHFVVAAIFLLILILLKIKVFIPNEVARGQHIARGTDIILTCHSSSLVNDAYSATLLNLLNVSDNKIQNQINTNNHQHHQCLHHTDDIILLNSFKILFANILNTAIRCYNNSLCYCYNNYILTTINNNKRSLVKFILNDCQLNTKRILILKRFLSEVVFNFMIAITFVKFVIVVIAYQQLLHNGYIIIQNLYHKHIRQCEYLVCNRPYQLKSGHGLEDEENCLKQQTSLETEMKISLNSAQMQSESVNHSNEPSQVDEHSPQRQNKKDTLQYSTATGSAIDHKCNQLYHQQQQLKSYHHYCYQSIDYTRYNQFYYHRCRCSCQKDHSFYQLEEKHSLDRTQYVKTKIIHSNDNNNNNANIERKTTSVAGRQHTKISISSSVTASSSLSSFNTRRLPMNPVESCDSSENCSSSIASVQSSTVHIYCNRQLASCSRRTRKKKDTDPETVSDMLWRRSCAYTWCCGGFCNIFYRYSEYLHIHCYKSCSTCSVFSHVCCSYCFCEIQPSTGGGIVDHTTTEKLRTRKMNVQSSKTTSSHKASNSHNSNTKSNSNSSSSSNSSNHQLNIIDVSTKNPSISPSRQRGGRKWRIDSDEDADNDSDNDNENDNDNVNDTENGNNLLRSLNAVKAITSVVQNRNYKRKLKKNLVWLFIGLVWLEGPKLINCSISHNNNDVTSISGNETTNKIGSSQSNSSDSNSGSSNGGGDGARNGSRSNNGNSGNINSPGPGPRTDASEAKENIKSGHFYKITHSLGNAAMPSAGGVDNLNKNSFMQNTIAIEQALQVDKQYQHQMFSQKQQKQQDRIQPRKVSILSNKGFHSNRQSNGRLTPTPSLFFESEEANRAQSDLVRLESIKRQILTKLGLTEKPNVTHPLPKQFIWDTIYRADGIRSVSDFDFNDDHRTQEHMRLTAAVLEPPPLLPHHYQPIDKSINELEEIHTNQLRLNSANFSDAGNDVSVGWKLQNLTTSQIINDHKRQVLPKYQRKHRPQQQQHQQQQKLENHSKNMKSQSQSQSQAQSQGHSQSQGQSQGKASYSEPDYFEGDDFFGSTQEIITFAEKGKIYKKHRLVEFSPPSNKIPKQKLQIRNAEIHIRIEKVAARSPNAGQIEQRHLHRHKSKEPNLKIWIFQLIGNDFSSKGFDQVATFCTSLTVDHNVLGWQKLDITETVQHWYSKHQKEKLRLLIDCTGCGSRYILHLFDRKYHHSYLKSPPMSIRQPPQKLRDTQSLNKTSSTAFKTNKPDKSQRYYYHYWQYNHHRYRRKNRAILTQRATNALNSSESVFHQRQHQQQPTNEDTINQLHMWQSTRRNRRSRETNNKEPLEGISYEVGAEYHLEDRLNPNRPFLVLHTEPTRSRRVRRRAVDCSGAMHGQCCKESFYVSFKALGWDDWIIAPRGYFANYCRGDCTGPYRTPDTFQTFHAHFIEEYRKMGLLNGMQPCCAPVKFSSMSLIYYGDDGIIKRDLPKMVVDECGCP